MQMLRPGYQPPSRKVLSEGLLDKVYNKITKSIKEKVSGEDGTLLQDGWSDIQSTPVIASTLHVKEQSYFLSAMEPGANKRRPATTVQK